MAVAVLVDEDHGYQKYVNMVDDPDKVRAIELGEDIDVGPKKVEYCVSLSLTGEVEVYPYQQQWPNLGMREVNRLKRGLPYYASLCIDYASEKLGVEGCDFYLCQQAWQKKLRAAMWEGDLLEEPEWYTSAEREHRINVACSGNDFDERKTILYELVLDGRVSEEDYAAARPSYSEIASMCLHVSTLRDEGYGWYDAWSCVLEPYSGEVQAHVFSTITGEAPPPLGEMMHKHLCARLVTERYSTAPMLAHFKVYESASEEDESVRLDAEVLARCLNYGPDDDYEWDAWQRLLSTSNDVD